MAVPAVHDGEMVEAEQPIEPGKACQQQHLDEREVRRQQAREPGEARHELGGVIHLRDVAVRVPEPDDPRRVADQQRERDGGPLHLDKSSSGIRRMERAARCDDGPTSVMPPTLRTTGSQASSGSALGSLPGGNTRTTIFHDPYPVYLG